MELGAAAGIGAIDNASLLYGAAVALCREPPPSDGAGILSSSSSSGESKSERGSSAVALAKGTKALARPAATPFASALASCGAGECATVAWKLATLSASDDAVALSLVRIASSTPMATGFVLATVSALRSLGRIGVLELSAGPLALIALARLEGAATGAVEFDLGVSCVLHL